MSSKNKISFAQRFISVFHNAVAAWIILACSVALTFIGYKVASDYAEQHELDQFEFRVEEIMHAIESRMSVYESALRGGVGLFGASQRVDRDEWKAFVDTLQINKYWPGIQGMGFAVPVTAENLETHIQKIRAEGFPDYTVKPEGKRQEYTAIVYLEPFDFRNKRAFGYDMWSNEMRRKAMARARDTGRAATSGIITLVQETEKDVQKGFLTYLPVYNTPDKHTPATLAERREKFIGWVYAPFRAGDLMKGILGSSDANISFEIFDGEVPSEDSLLFDSNDKLQFNSEHHVPIFKTTRTIVLQGRPWTVYFSRPQNIQTSEFSTPSLIVAIGLVIDVLLFYVIYSIYSIQQRARSIADKMTAEIQEKNAMLQQKTAELEASNKELEQFAYVASHDLQEPLRKISAYSEVLEDELKDNLNAENSQYLNVIRSSALRMKDLISDILQYSRVTRMNEPHATIDPNEILKQVLQDLENRIQSTNAKIKIDDLPLLHGNARQVQQLFQNLIGNALKFIPKERTPQINITATQEQNWTYISVQDNGIGIAKEQQDKIFMPFQRLHSRKEFEGTGIGLAICIRVVECHGGSLKVESDGKTGTTFVAKLPSKR